jgi:hypothetical protein
MVLISSLYGSPERDPVPAARPAAGGHLGRHASAAINETAIVGGIETLAWAIATSQARYESAPSPSLRAE